MSKTKGRRAQRRFMQPKPSIELPALDQSDLDLLKEIRYISQINGMGHAFKRRHEDRHRGYGSQGTF